MAVTRIKGFVLNLTIGGLHIKGLETTGLKSKPVFEELLLKENAGVAVQTFTEYDATLSFSGKTFLKDGTETTMTDYEALRASVGAGTNVAFVYGDMTSGKKKVAGTGYISDYSEDSDSKSLGSFSGTIQVRKGSVTFPTT